PVILSSTHFLIQSRSFLNRQLYAVSPLRPRTIVVAHGGIAEQAGEHEPTVAAAFTDAAVGDDIVRRLEPLLFLVDGAQVGRALEGAIRVGGTRPRHALGAG